MGEYRTLQDDGCFRIVRDEGDLWVEELLHGWRGDIPKRWRITFASPENASRFIAARLRDSHNDLYHFPARPQGLAG